MENIEKVIKEFKESEFNKDYKSRDMRITSKEDMEYVITKRAYHDMQIRTVKKNRDDAIFDEKEKANVLEWLVNEFYGFFNGDICQSNEKFYDWHLKTCSKFLKDFNEKVLKDNYNPIHYGKAQKIVNMSFKYLRCFNDAMEHLELFNYCHMPIDSFIINWYNTENIGKGEMISCAWSNLNKNCYYSIQDNIKIYCAQNNITPLEKDFIEWKKAKDSRKRTLYF